MRLSIFHATGHAKGPMVPTMLPIVAGSAGRAARLRQSQAPSLSCTAAPSPRCVAVSKGANLG
jgi:hypothetical protein